MTKTEGFGASTSRVEILQNIGIRGICTEAIVGFVFWSLFQGLAPMIWFYPLNELEVTGYECIAVVWLSPLITGIPGVLALLQNKWILGALRLVSVACVASFQAKTTLTRLIILAIGNATAMLTLTADIWSTNQTVRYRTFWSLVLGLQTLVCSRIWFTSFIPTWWSAQANSVVLSIGLIAVVDKFLTQGNNKSDGPCKPPSFTPNCFFTGLGFGSLLYLTQWCFGEVSLITRWGVQGFPNTGPQPYPWGVVVLLAITCGILLSWSGISRSQAWWVVGSSGLAALYYLPTWIAYSGGLLLALFTFSIWPEMVERLSLCKPARTWVIAIITYLVEIFFSVWTVAFNFVPGGVYTREHTDYLIGFVCVCLYLGLFSGKKREESCFFTNCDNDQSRMAAKSIKCVVIFLAVIGLSGFVYRYDPNRYHQPVKTEPKEFTAAIWTYHFGYDNKGWPSLLRSGVLLNNTGADFITLLESDASKPFLGNNDLGMWLGEKLNMFVDFGPSTKKHTWGNLILSKYPIVNSTHHLLPSPHGELAPAVTATVNYSGSLVDFVVAHMGNDRDRVDRKLQTEYLADELKNSKNPSVFLGYMTNTPHSPNYQTLIRKGGVKDIAGEDMDRWCEYIMYKQLIRLGYARISHGGLSDTEVQMARFRIPTDPSNYKDHDREVTDPLQVSKNQRFTKKFGPFRDGHHYVLKHRYHMSTPRYFLP